MNKRVMPSGQISWQATTDNSKDMRLILCLLSAVPLQIAGCNTKTKDERFANTELHRSSLVYFIIPAYQSITKSVTKFIGNKGHTVNTLMFAAIYQCQCHILVQK